MKKGTEITNESLVAAGWKEIGDGSASSLRKVLSDLEDNDPDDGEIALVLHWMYNAPMIALSLPDGSLLNINAESMEQLEVFEKMIHSFDPPY